MTAKTWVEAAFALVMIVGPLLIIWSRIWPRHDNDDSPRGLGMRVAQVIGLFLIIPAVAILSLECRLSNETVGTLLGTIIGFTLSGIPKRFSGTRKIGPGDGKASPSR